MINIKIDLTKDFSLNVGAHKIHVKFVSLKNKKLTEDPKEEINYGTYQPQEKTIYISKDQPESIKFSTLIHELIHVAEDIYLVKMNHVQLNILSEMFAQILLSTDN